MKVLMITSEAVPYSKSGGLADVVGSLPPALINKGIDARIIIPAYGIAPEQTGEKICQFDVPMLGTTECVTITQRKTNSVPYYFVCHPFFCNRQGIYGDTSFTPYSDNMERFSLFCKAAIILCIKINWIPDIIHCHDWTCGLVPTFLKQFNSECFANTKTVFTIHNLAYQGIFSRINYLLTNQNPSPKLFFNKQLNMMKAGITTSDIVTTVSPTYAKEIQTQEQGCGLENVLIEKKQYLKGIVNGINTDEWNPQTDPLISKHFSQSDLSGKANLKLEIQKEFGLQPKQEVPLFAMISRLASQKGFDTLIPCLENILQEIDLQFIIIGTGDASIENKLKDIATRNSNISVNILFSNKAAHMIEAGSDFFLMPSLYEPCGLNQLYSLRYGTIPIATKTGGLADTIIDLNQYPEEGTGLLLEQPTPEQIYSQVLKATQLYKQNNFNQIVKRAMNQDFSWNNSADQYIEVYEQCKKIQQREK